MNTNENPFDEDLEDDDHDSKKIFLVIFLVIIGIIIVYFSNISDSNATSKSETASAETRCKDEVGRPKASACRKALRSKGFNVDKYVKWSGADNGTNAAVCTATDADGVLYAFNVVFDEKCNGVSVELANY
ncbi:MAG: hypothetical protein SOZ02_06390 [Hallerella porci]|uniref:Uncharacterized protein n=1 Tax=Hallerella porci TaxID=1945871 RepID=A0ABX5LL63_9BACT|nr:MULTISPECIES: hypothetical protein [Hallerella]MCI5601578.1 hypothetical protein [Hallerella sp.]MDY3921775.1 hypothetical protein [Hallerella porci]PWK96066.1 hypothetical protein B0H50_11735 [Hallerella porci]